MTPKKTILTSSMLLLSTFLLHNPQAVMAEETTTNPAVTTTSSAETTTNDTNANLSTAATSSHSTNPENTSTPVDENASNPSATDSTEANKTTVILHTNDIHGRMQEDRGVIGLAKLATLVDEERAKSDQNTLVLDAGDAFQGLPISNASKGEEVAKAMNAIGYDAMAVGNHEFDFSLDQAVAYKEKLTFPLLSTNTYLNGARLFEASTIIDKTPDILGDEVVVIGVTTPETSTKTHPKNVERVVFADPISEVKKAIEQIEASARAEGKEYQTYVILAHLGIDPSTPLEWRGDTLAQALSEYQTLTGKKVIVIDGHSHTVHSASFGDNVTYSQTGSYLNNIGKITLAKDGSVSTGLISATDTSKLLPNETVAAIVANAKANFDAENAKVILENNTVELNGDRENVRVRETNSGKAITDALYSYGCNGGFSRPTDLAVTNGGGIRATIAAGQPITKGDIIAVLPFGNIISQIEVKGSQILDMFERSLSSTLQTDADGKVVTDDKGHALLTPAGHFLHISGARVFYNPQAEAKNRVLRVEILDPATGNYKPLTADATYYLATNDFVAAGGDGYTMLGGAREEGPSMDQVFADFLSKRTDLSEYSEINTNKRLIPLDPVADTDGDGMTNGEELANGRDPLVVDKKNEPRPNTHSATIVSRRPSSNTSITKVSQETKTSHPTETRVIVDKQSSTETDNLKTSKSQSKPILPKTGDTSSLLNLFGTGLLASLSLLSPKIKRD